MAFLMQRQGSSLRRRIFALLLAVLPGLCYPSASLRAQDETAEYYVKAAFLYHFTKFVRWPTADGPVTVCIAGRDPFGEALEILDGETVNQQPIRLRREVREGDWADCQILYLSPSLKARWKRLRAELARRPVLTVSDMEGFAESGGMIGFVNHKQRVKLVVNPVAAEQATLGMDPGLLEVAHQVIGRGAP